MNENNKIIRIGILIIILVYIIYLLFNSFIKMTDIRKLIITLLFSIAMIFAIISNITVMIGNYNLGKIFSKISSIIIIIIWFGMIAFFEYIFIKEKQYVNMLLIIPFIFLGICMVYNSFIKNR